MRFAVERNALTLLVAAACGSKHVVPDLKMDFSKIKVSNW